MEILRFTTRKDARRAGVQYKVVEPGQYRQMRWPPRLNYSLQALKEHDKEQYDMVTYILRDIAETEFGFTGKALEVHNKYMDHMFRTGLIKPNFREEDDGYMIYFTMWSFFQGKYVDFAELEPFEQAYCDYVFMRLFNVN